MNRRKHYINSSFQKHESFLNQLPYSLYKGCRFLPKLLKYCQKARLCFVFPHNFFLRVKGSTFSLFSELFNTLDHKCNSQNIKNCVLLDSIVLEAVAGQLTGTPQCHFRIKQSTRWTACYNRCFLAPGTKPAQSHHPEPFFEPRWVRVWNNCCLVSLTVIRE